MGEVTQEPVAVPTYDSTPVDSDSDLNGLLVLKANTGLVGSDVKKYDIVRVEATNDQDQALKDLPEGKYIVVDPGTLAEIDVSYKLVQVNEAV